MDNKKHLSEKMRYKDALPVSIYTMQKWIKEAKALEAENKRLKEGIASIIRDSKNDGSYLIVPIRKLLELNQAPTGGGDRRTKNPSK